MALPLHRKVHTSGPWGSPESIPLPTRGAAHQPGQAPPTWRCQQRPRCSPSGCPRSPPGTRGHQAPGATPPTRQELWRPPRGQRERGRPLRSPGRPTAPDPIPAMLVSSPGLPPAQIHPRAAQPTHTCSPAGARPQLSDHPGKPPGVQTLGAHSRGHGHTHTQAQPSDSQGRTPACSPATTRRASPATHRPPERTAAAESRRCSLGKPQSGSPCCEWPSCAPAWASSKDSPGRHGGCPRGLLTLAAPSKAPRGAPRGRHTQAHVRSGKAPSR